MRGKATKDPVPGSTKARRIGNRNDYNLPFICVLKLFWCLVFGVWCCSAAAATTSETNAFYTARENFRLEFWGPAEKGFADFARKYTNSDYYAAAISFEAQCLFKQRRYSDAIYLLSTEQSRAGALAEDFAWWTGRCQFALTNYIGASDTFGRFLKDYRVSVRRLSAAVWQAKALGEQRKWPQVIEILGQPNGPFQQLAKISPGTADAITGYLRLAEAQLELRDYLTAEQTLRNLANQKLEGDDEWQRKYLLGRVQLSAGRTEEALATCTNLLALARGLTADLKFRTLALEADVLEQGERLSDAITAYQQNLGTDVPLEVRQQALLKIVELHLRQNETQAATMALEQYLTAYPNEKSSELATLTLGELKLRQYCEATAAPGKLLGLDTNLLEQAIANFNSIATSTNTNYSGKAELNLGWCLLMEKRAFESEAAFSNAVARLSPSEDQAVARFKLGDAEFGRTNYAGALADYRHIITDYQMLPSVTNQLFEPALYQMIQVALNGTNLAAASEAMEHLLAWFPDRASLEPGTLLLGQGMTRDGQATAARAMLQAFIQRAYDSPLVPEVQLAIARTFEAEGDWTNAIASYDSWLTAHTNSASREKAEFAIAWANAAAGRESNALTLFTNFVACRKSSELAPLAQSWVADHYWCQQEFVEAESNFKYVFQTWPASPLAARARMWAGRSAYALEHVSDAIDHFTNLTSRADLPLDLRLEAEFAYADALIKMSNYDRAIQILKDVTNSYPANPAALLALGRLADCYFNLAGADPAHYSFDIAATNYQAVMDSLLAEISTRSSAEVKLGKTLESKVAQMPPDADPTHALLSSALIHYLNVVHGGNLRQGERQNMYWVKDAGVSAGELAEKLGQTAMTEGKGIDAANHWQSALNLYEVLRDLFPSMRQFWERKITRLQERLAATKATR